MSVFAVLTLGMAGRADSGSILTAFAPILIGLHLAPPTTTTVPSAGEPTPTIAPPPPTYPPIDVVTVPGSGSGSGSQVALPVTGRASGARLSPAVGTGSAAIPGLVTGIDTATSNDDNAVAQIGRSPGLINGFWGFVHPDGTPDAFPRNWAIGVLKLGSTPMVTWQPNLADSDTNSVLATIASGKEDGYIANWAYGAAALRHRLYVRLMHEMNGDWYPWGAVVAGHTRSPSGGTYPYTNTPAMYVAAYQHVVNLFRAAGATNVVFEWCVGSGGPVSSLGAYYPGDSYVDWAGIDGYNKDATSPRPFDQIIGGAYRAVTALGSRPVMVAEMASVEFSGQAGDPASKAQWITDAFLTEVPTEFPRVQAMAYNDAPGRSGSETFPMDSSPAALQAVKIVFADPRWAGTAP